MKIREKVIKKQKIKKSKLEFNYRNKRKMKNGPIDASRKRPIPKAVICFCSSIIPLMINKMLKNPIIKGKI